MLLQLVRGKNKFLFGCLLGRIVMVRIKRVDHECTVDLDGIRFVFAVEEDTAAETAHGRFARLV
ncbi:MAG: hypothetical protein ACYC3X_22970 [Pirellulaceae bacterium]